MESTSSARGFPTPTTTASSVIVSLDHQPFFPPPYRISDASPPSKRPRLSPSRPTSVARTNSKPSASNNKEPALDIEKAREASALRLLDVWAGLAERYCKPINEDDIIDLYTGKIHKSRGVLKSAKKTFKIGCFSEATSRDAEGDTGEKTDVDSEDDIEELEGDGEEEEEIHDDEDDEEDDPLDVLRKSKHAQNERIHAFIAGPRMVPPLRRMDSTDAADLDQFLKDERKRRVAAGEFEEEESDEEGYDMPNLEDDFLSLSEEELAGDAYVTTDVEEPPDSQADTGYERSSSPYQNVDTGSDDELMANWRDYKPSAMKSRPPTTQVGESDSEVEIIASSHPIPSRPTTRTKTANQTPKPFKPTMTRFVHSRPVFLPNLERSVQLHTPPLSYSSSSVPSSTPFDEDSEAPAFSRTSSPLPPSSPPSSYYSSSPVRSRPNIEPFSLKTPKPLSKYGSTSNEATTRISRFPLPTLAQMGAAKITKYKARELRSSPIRSTPSTLPASRSPSPVVPPRPPRESRTPFLKKTCVEVVISTPGSKLNKNKSHHVVSKSGTSKPQQKVKNETQHLEEDEPPRPPPFRPKPLKASGSKPSLIPEAVANLIHEEIKIPEPPPPKPHIGLCAHRRLGFHDATYVVFGSFSRV